jgi:hypothetical protein
LVAGLEFPSMFRETPILILVKDSVIHTRLHFRFSVDRDRVSRPLSADSSSKTLGSECGIFKEFHDAGSLSSAAPQLHGTVCHRR